MTNNSPFSRAARGFVRSSHLCFRSGISPSLSTSICSCHRIQSFRIAVAAHITFHLHPSAMPLFPINHVAGTAKRTDAFLDFQNLERIHVAFIQAQFFFQTANFRIFVNSIVQSLLTRNRLCTMRISRHHSVRNSSGIFITAHSGCPCGIPRQSVPGILLKSKRIVPHLRLHIRTAYIQFIRKPVMTTVKRFYLPAPTHFHRIRDKNHRFIFHYNATAKLLFLGAFVADIRHVFRFRFSLFIFTTSKDSSDIAHRLGHKLKVSRTYAKRKHQNQSQSGQQNNQRSHI